MSGREASRLIEASSLVAFVAPWNCLPEIILPLHARVHPDTSLFHPSRHKQKLCTLVSTHFIYNYTFNQLLLNQLVKVIERTNTRRWKVPRFTLKTSSGVRIYKSCNTDSNCRLPCGCLMSSVVWGGSQRFSETDKTNSIGILTYLICLPHAVLKRARLHPATPPLLAQTMMPNYHMHSFYLELR